jgi:hypothetical protein
VHWLPKHRLDVGSRQAGDLAQLGSLLADDDALVCVALDDQRGGDLSRALLLFPAIDRHGNAVRQFVTEQSIRLLANRLCGEETRAAIGVLLGIEKRQALR